MSDETQKQTAAESQVELARVRTLLALDRTLLAWIRTSISLLAFGFTLAKFVHNLVANGSIDVHYPRHIGIVLMGLGVAGALGGAFEYRRSVKKIHEAMDTSIFSTSLVLALALAVVGVVLTVSLLSDLTQQ